MLVMTDGVLPGPEPVGLGGGMLRPGHRLGSMAGRRREEEVPCDDRRRRIGLVRVQRRQLHCDRRVKPGACRAIELAAQRFVDEIVREAPSSWAPAALDEEVRSDRFVQEREHRVTRQPRKPLGERARALGADDREQPEETPAVGRDTRQTATDDGAHAVGNDRRAVDVLEPSVVE